MHAPVKPFEAPQNARYDAETRTLYRVFAVAADLILFAVIFALV